MLDLKSVDTLYPVLMFIVPGLIILSIRSQFVTGRRPSHAAALLSYLAVSAFYYALILPFVDFSEPPAVAVWFFLVFVGPAIAGLLLGIEIQYDLSRKFLRCCRLNPVHSIPTAWDRKFSRMGSQWVLVTLKNGTTFAGYCDSDSFMSSDPAERDIYVSWLYDIGENDEWVPRDECSVLIASGEVSTIEFWPYKENCEWLRTTNQAPTAKS